MKIKRDIYLQQLIDRKDNGMIKVITGIRRCVISRNARLNFRQQEPTHIMENIVYNELLIRGYNVDVGVIDVYDKDKEGKCIRKQLEVDFVVNQSSQRYYIQVA